MPKAMPREALDSGGFQRTLKPHAIMLLREDEERMGVPQPTQILERFQRGLVQRNVSCRSVFRLTQTDLLWVATDIVPPQLELFTRAQAGVQSESYRGPPFGMHWLHYRTEPSFFLLGQEPNHSILFPQAAHPASRIGLDSPIINPNTIDERNQGLVAIYRSIRPHPLCRCGLQFPLNLLWRDRVSREFAEPF
ncbi:MAG TPA: hypothetical protein VMI94_26465 [Bryobacteraceae bacterium]|nr:hypothetical protein [Bryobacteraceae bacterium]